MKRYLLIIVALCAMSAAAQQQPAPPQSPAGPSAMDDARNVVAIVNGEVITREKLDQLYQRLGSQMRMQYEKTGGKGQFLENYIRKRLMIQEALKSGFDKRADVIAEMEAAKESALFDRYIRDVVSAPIVTDAAIRKYYEENKEQFAIPETAKVRHIIVTAQQTGPQARSKEQALEIIRGVAAELHKHRPADNTEGARRVFLSRFAEAAQKVSEDGSAPSGGDLGWVEKGVLDPKFEAAAFAMQPGTLSGVVETSFGYHLIFVEEKRPATTEPFDEVRSAVREFLMAQNAATVVETVNKLTNELRGSSKITVFPENIR